MKGTIKTYLPEKKYGFIKGDDGKDYFFHKNEFSNPVHAANLCEEAFVSFEQQATPKGYRARICSLVDPSEVLTYVTPDDFITSRTSNVTGWEIIERAGWIIHGTSRDSPDAARADARTKASWLDANALIEFNYYKTTGSEAGTGRGTHHFTIHNFRGRPVTLAKRNSRGRYRAQELSGLNERAASLKASLVAQTKASERKRNLVWLVVLILCLLALVVQTFWIAVVFIVGLIFGHATDHDSWLERA